MITKKINNLKIDIGKKEAFEYQTDTYLPKMHQNSGIVGVRGAGKTISMVNLVEKMNYDRIFLVSCTIHSNRDILARLNIDEQDIYQDTDDINLLTSIIQEIDFEAEDLERYWEEMKQYKKLMKSINDNAINDELLLEFYNPALDLIEKPEHKWNGRKPRLAIIFDDCLSSKVFVGKGIQQLNKLTVTHRHRGQLKLAGGALGVSLYFLVQSYTTNTGGISKTIRNNFTSVIIFKTKNERELKQITEELSGEVSPELFLEVYNYATSEPHSFLFVDLHRKKEHPSMFRKGFDTFILTDDIQAILDERKTQELQNKLSMKLEKSLDDVCTCELEGKPKFSCGKTK